MNWRNVYIHIINNAKSRKIKDDEIYEIHHILPRSLFPNWKNKASNKVYLTLREHYFVHELLVKIYPSEQMAFALWQMSMKYKLSGSRDYEFAKKMYHQYAVEYWNTIEKRLSQREIQIEVWKNKELLEKHSKILKEVMNKPEIAAKRNAGVREARCTPVRCIQTGEVFNSLTEASEWCGLKTIPKIGMCARGERKFAGKHPITKEKLSWEYTGHINKKKSKIRKIKTKCEDIIFNTGGVAYE